MLDGYIDLTVRPSFCYDVPVQMESPQKKVAGVFGVVTEALPNTMFKVKLEGQEEEILTYLAGKMRLHRIRVLVGDKVFVELEPYGGKGRIIKRL